MKYSGVEKRRFVRAKFPCKIIISTPKECTINTHTENIGVGGVMVIIDQKLEVSSFVDLEIYLGDKPISCKARIVWIIDNINPLSGNSITFDTGIEFYNISAKDKKTINDLVEAIVSDKNDFRKD
jgi:hypothetical protein